MNVFDYMFFSFFGIFFIFYFGILVFIIYLLKRMGDNTVKDYVMFFIFAFMIPVIGPIVYYLLKKFKVFDTDKIKNRKYEKFTPYKGETK